MNRKHQTKLITFTNVSETASEYAPKPSVNFIPEWYRKMEIGFPKKQTPDSLPTIKKCIPVLDAITSGYIIVLPCDVYISTKDGEPNYNSALPNLISFHSRKQAYKHPEANDFQFPKWINPWAIKTPKGYSTLFVQPFHRESVFTILPGIVDTDKYFAAVNFPFVLNDPLFEGLIPAGTPIAQVIPFKRDSWKMELGSEEEFKKQLNIAQKLNTKFFNRYKTMFWSRKEYK